MSATATLLQQLGCRLPLIQAPMAGVQGSRLAIAVCRAGGLGSLPAAMLSPEQLADEIRAVRVHTDAPFNVNFFAHRQPELSAAAQRDWQRALAPFYRQLGLDPAAPPAGSARQPFGEAQAEVVAALKPPVVSFHFGLPPAPLLQQVKHSGAVVMASATTVAEARWLAQHGADIIIAQGLEAGGHRGWFLNHDVTTQLGTFSLLPQICAAVSLPVVAAGGIADAATARAARVLGAAGIQVGTALLLADEADTSTLHRTALQSPRAEHTALTNVFSGGCARGIVNHFITTAGPMHPSAPPFPLAQTAVAPLKAAAEAQGSDDFSSLWAGQNAPLARAGAAADIVCRLAAAFAGQPA